jgi:hypothetical protein
MLRFCCIIIVLFFYTYLSGQTRYGYELPDSSIYSITSKSNVLYAGIDNQLLINDTLLYQFDTVLLKCNNGIILYDSLYIVIPRKPGNLRIEVHAEKNGKTDTLGFSNFRVFSLPAPIIAFDTIALHENMKMSREDFIQADSLYILISEDIPDSKNWIQIREFSIGFNYSGYFIEASSKDSSINQEMKKLVLAYGNWRWFSIKLITQSGTSLMLTNPMFKVFFY